MVISTPDAKPINVLLIEDNPTDVRLVQELLSGTPSDHFAIISASTLGQGLEHLSSDHVDVILLDLGLPDSQGFDTFRAIEEHAPYLPIIILTVSTDEELGRKALLEGAQQFFSKDVLTPVGAYAEMFPRMIRFAIERKRVETELQKAHEERRELNEELQATSADLQAANQELECRVQQRTEELVVTNEALLREIEERANAEQEAQSRALRVALLNEIIHVLNETSDLATLFEHALTAIIGRLQFNSGLIATKTHTGYLEIQYAHDLPPAFTETMNHVRIDLTHYLPAIYKRGELLIRDEQPTDSIGYRFGLRGASVIIPFMSEGAIIGHLALYSVDHQSFSYEQRELFQTIGREFGTAVSKLRAKEQAQEYAAQLKQHTDHLEDLITERTAQLKDAERLAAIGQTAAMIGHDLRNPLQALQLLADLAATYYNDVPPELKERFDAATADRIFASVEKQIQYMDKVVSDLQDYARPLNVEPETVHLAAFVTDTLALLTIPKSIDVTIEISDAMKAKVDPHLMHRVFSNLFLNALQAMSDDGTLTIAAASSDSSVAVSISDTGIGIPAHMHDKIFSPLTTGKAKGTGLGLAVVKRIVEAHGGSIELESEGGKGTTFTITIPQTAE
ncbi:MAG: ATP-binding protein [Halobacteriota archaeon]